MDHNMAFAVKTQTLLLALLALFQQVARYCNLPWYGSVDDQLLDSQIAYLRGVTNRFCDCPPRIYPNCPDIASYAEWIQSTCGIGARLQGLLFNVTD